LSHEERKDAIRLTRATLDENGFQNVAVIAGTGAQSTRETIQLCVDAKEAGASHALVLTPSTWLPQMTVDNIIRFHRAVADASPIPTMVYNFPVVTAGLDLDSDTISALAKHPNIVGTKLSCGNIGKLQRLTSTFKQSEFAVFAGKSDVLLQGLLSGSAGGICALVNVTPKIHAELFRLWKEGKIGEAMTLQAAMGHADWAAQKIGGIGGIKSVVSKAFGYGGSTVRGPLKPVEPDSLQGNKYFDTLQTLIAEEKKL
jgi:4-hydroxy-2-oxoglutarate aldolase